MNVIVIENENSVAAFLQKGLTEEGHIVDDFSNSKDGVYAVLEKQYDLLILDWTLPDLDGTDICHFLRGQGAILPIILLSARHTIGDRVKGLDAGADDYLTKPFAFEELLARIRAIMRRDRPNKTPSLRVGDLELDPLSHTVKRGNRNIDLTPREYALLKFLIQRPGRVLSRTILVEQVWDRQFDIKSNVVDVYINYLRNKLVQEGKEQLIHTIRGTGYMLADKKSRLK